MTKKGSRPKIVRAPARYAGNCAGHAHWRRVTCELQLIEGYPESVFLDSHLDALAQRLVHSAARQPVPQLTSNDGSTAQGPIANTTRENAAASIRPIRAELASHASRLASWRRAWLPAIACKPHRAPDRFSAAASGAGCFNATPLAPIARALSPNAATPQDTLALPSFSCSPDEAAQAPRFANLERVEDRASALWRAWVEPSSRRLNKMLRRVPRRSGAPKPVPWRTLADAARELSPYIDLAEGDAATLAMGEAEWARAAHVLAAGRDALLARALRVLRRVDEHIEGASRALAELHCTS